ncbi:MAG: DNA internalization-related competence protein ComEC/Rec2, partial [Oscillibacter sp.]|nr:DNA internalization-related competence protein ComEC/Rec2 [Oscillibacter sp.]
MLPAGFVCLLLGIGSFFLPELYQKRLLLVLLGLSVAFGYNWLYVRQVQRPAEALVDTTQQVTMTIFDAPITHKDGAK